MGKNNKLNSYKISKSIGEVNETDSVLQHHFIDEPFLESLDEWVWEMDLNGIHTYSNAAVEKILGFKVKEIIGFSTTKLWPKIDKKNNIPKLQKSLAAGKGWKNYLAYFIHKDGSVRILLSSGIPVYDEKGILKSYRGIDRDITERVMNENALKTQKEHIKLINQVLRHDITNDLSIIKSSIRLYKNSGDQKYLDEIRNNIDRSAKLIRSMSNLESFIMEKKDFKVFSVSNVLSQILKCKKDIEFSIEGESRILADELIYSVFENLINNAIIHGLATKITIKIQNEKALSKVSFNDNGIGIPDKLKNRLFEEGFTSGSNGHTGIGLHIVKQAMESYNGSVEVQDNKPRGTTFKLVFHRMG